MGGMHERDGEECGCHRVSDRIYLLWKVVRGEVSC